MKASREFLLLSNQQRNSGGFLGTLLASIDISLLLNALAGKGMQDYNIMTVY